MMIFVSLFRAPSGCEPGGVAMMCSWGGQTVEMNFSFVSEAKTLDGA
jgi:hypothetical protein